MNQPTIAVLGCGPAGLLAAHAARLMGGKVTIFSNKRKSPIGGAQFLHVPIPKITREEPDDWCSIMKVGSREGYATKVYGDPNARCSWDDYEEAEQPIWNMRAAYDRLWG